jgi:hypothetical protein
VPAARAEQTARSSLLLTRAVEGGVLGFVILVALAMLAYPGGTFFDATQPGHSFWHNFLCDLIQARSLSGEPNALGARLAASGMLALVCSMVAFVGLVPALVTVRGGLMRALFAVGAVACVLTALVPLLPSDRFGGLHAAAVLGAGIPVDLALIALSVALYRATHMPRFIGALSLMLSAVVSASLALYVREVLLDATALPIVPVLSRLANLLLLVWLVSLARHARVTLSREPSSGQAHARAFDHG